MKGTRKPVTGRPFMISKKHHEVGMCRRGSEASIACLLDRKLGVLHVALVLLEQRVDPRQLLQCLRHRRFHRRLYGIPFSVLPH